MASETQELDPESAVAFLKASRAKAAPQPQELDPEQAVAFLRQARQQGGLPSPRSEPPQGFATPLPLAAFAGQALEGFSSLAGLGRIASEKLSGVFGEQQEAPLFSGLESGLKGFAEEAYPQAQRGTGGLMSETVPGVLGGIAATAPGIALGGPAAAISFGAQTGVPLYYEVKSKTGDEEAATWALLGGAAIGQLERFGAEKYLGGIISKLSKGKLGNAVKDAVLGWAIAGPQEAGTEAIQQGLSDLLQEELTGEELDKLKRMGEVIPPALIVGTGFGAIHSAVNRPAPQAAQAAPQAQQTQAVPEAVQTPISPPEAAQAVQRTVDLREPDPEILALAKDINETDEEWKYTLQNDASGVVVGAPSAVDRILRGPAGQALYDAFKPVREALRQKYGDSLTLWRAQGTGSEAAVEYGEKLTLNYASKSGAQQYMGPGRALVSRTVPIDDIIAIQHPTSSGKYEEFVVLHPQVADTEGPRLRGASISAVQEPAAPAVEVAAPKATQEGGTTIPEEPQAAAEETVPQTEPLRAKLEEDMTAPEIGTPEEWMPPPVRQEGPFQAELFHGTNTPGLMELRQPEGGAGRHGNRASALGVFFTPNYGDAERYSRARNLGKGIEYGAKGSIYKQTVSLENPIYVSWADFKEKILLGGDVASQRRKLEGLGHDGIIVKNPNGDVVEVVSFRPVPVGAEEAGSPLEESVIEEAKKSPHWKSIQSLVHNSPRGGPGIEDLDALLREASERSGKSHPKQVTELFAGPPLKLGGIPAGKIKAKLKDWFIRAGPTHAPKAAKRALEISKGFSEAEMSEVSDRARELDRAVSKLHGKNWQAKPIAQDLDAAFEDPAKLAALPDELKRPLSLMRGHLDQIIREQVRTGAVAPQSQLAQIVLGSTGKYSKREYRAFNDVKWAEKVDPAVKQRFADMLIKEGKTPDEAAGITEAILQEAKEAAGNPWQFLQSSKLGNKNLSIYKKRKNVPEELKALLGEIKDPIANYANSVTRIAGVIARHKAYTEIRASGMKEGWLSEPKKRAKGHSATISSEGNPSLAPLDGMHTTPEIKEALTSVDSATMASYLRPVMAVNSAIKWGKVLGQPTAFMRNLASNITISLANGHMPLWFKGEAWKHAFQHGGLDERKRLIRLGVLGEGVNTVEWNDYREALKKTPEELATAQRGPLAAAKAGTEKLYSAADNLPKIMGFYAEEAALIEAGKSPQEAESLASDRIRDLYPTPARMAQGLKLLRRQPLIGQYFSFKAEMIRTFINRLKLIKSELVSDNPKIRKMGAKRIMGSVIAHGATPAAALTWRLLQGQDKEDDDDLREFVPEWDKDHELISVGSRLKGQYVDLSDIDPTTMFTDPLMRVAAGDDPDETFIKWLKDNGEAFWDFSPVASLVIESYTKRDNQGRPIDDRWEHAWKEVRPGFVAWWDRAKKDFGPDDVASFAIARTYDYDVEKALGKEISNYYRLISESSQKASRRIGRGKEERGARKEQEAERRKAFDDLSRKARAAMRLGLSSYKVEEMLDDQLSGEQTDAVLSGSYLPYEPPE